MSFNKDHSLKNRPNFRFQWLWYWWKIWSLTFPFPSSHLCRIHYKSLALPSVIFKSRFSVNWRGKCVLRLITLLIIELTHTWAYFSYPHTFTQAPPLYHLTLDTSLKLKYSWSLSLLTHGHTFAHAPPLYHLTLSFSPPHPINLALSAIHTTPSKNLFQHKHLYEFWQE